jgi:Amt family ammonium transporter
VNGWGAMAIGAIGSTIVYFALNYLSRLRPFRRVDDTLGVVYTHGFAGLTGGLLVGIFADPKIIEYIGLGKTANVSVQGLIHGSGHLLKEQALAGLWVVLFSGIATFILLKLVSIFVPLRMAEKDMEEGDLAVHGHEVYPSDVPNLTFPNGVPQVAPSGTPAQTSAT